jgi:hypothetical protein
MFERGDDMNTVGAEGAMIAVVQQDDIALRLIRASGARETLDQTLWGLRFPVPATFRPHHDAADSGAANFSKKQRATVTVRRAHPARRFLL